MLLFVMGVYVVACGWVVAFSSSRQAV